MTSIEDKKPLLIDKEVLSSAKKPTTSVTNTEATANVVAEQCKLLMMSYLIN